MAKVLVVDDSRLSRRMTVDALLAEGHEVIEAENGELGLAAFREHAPACIVTDLLMPIMTGFEMIAAVRQESASVPIVVVTADVQTTSRQRCEEHGEVKMLNKPIQSAELTQLVSDAIGQFC
ncbi:MAG: response regulator [Planctomycetales bacterium]|nr:response regulator [Planctomycetales bacterium]